VDGIIFYCDRVQGHRVKTKKKYFLFFKLACSVYIASVRRRREAARTLNPFSSLKRSRLCVYDCLARTWLVHCGDQIGPVDIRGARPLHSGCCEAVLECAPHAVDSRIFGSMPPLLKTKKRFLKKYVNKKFCVYEILQHASKITLGAYCTT